MGKCIEAAKSKDYFDRIFCSLGAGAVAGLAIGDCFTPRLLIRFDTGVIHLRRSQAF